MCAAAYSSHMTDFGNSVFLLVGVIWDGMRGGVFADQLRWDKLTLLGFLGNSCHGFVKGRGDDCWMYK